MKFLGCLCLASLLVTAAFAPPCFAVEDREKPLPAAFDASVVSTDLGVRDLVVFDAEDCLVTGVTFSPDSLRCVLVSRPVFRVDEPRRDQQKALIVDRSPWVDPSVWQHFCAMFLRVNNQRVAIKISGGYVERGGVLFPLQFPGNHFAITQAQPERPGLLRLPPLSPAPPPLLGAETPHPAAVPDPIRRLANR